MSSQTLCERCVRRAETFRNTERVVLYKIRDLIEKIYTYQSFDNYRYPIELFKTFSKYFEFLTSDKFMNSCGNERAKNLFRVIKSKAIQFNNENHCPQLNKITKIVIQKFSRLGY